MFAAANGGAARDNIRFGETSSFNCFSLLLLPPPPSPPPLQSKMAFSTIHLYCVERLDKQLDKQCKRVVAQSSQTRGSDGQADK